MDNEIAVLRAQLSAERSRRETAEADAARAEADAARAEADAARAMAEAAREREQRAAAEKATFFTQMRAISSSSSADTSSNTDEVRRAAPVPTEGTVEDVISGGLPTASAPARSVAVQWRALVAALHERAAPLAAAGRLDENRDVHPVVAALLAAAAPRELRIWGNAIAEDDVACARIRPDFSLTHARDAAPSTLGALLLVEVKLPGSLTHALRQARAYLRRRVFKLCCERESRGEACDGVFALGIATDGAQLALLRMRSGAPPRGGSYGVAEPCPVVQTAPLALLGDWDFRGSLPAALAGALPPEGFAALVRICNLPCAMLGDGAPLESLRARVRWISSGGGGSDGGGGGGGGGFADVAAAAAAAGGGGGHGEEGGVEEEVEEVMLLFGARLGCGGSSDVYELHATSGAAGAGHGGTVVKVARVATAALRESFEAERVALSVLRPAALRGLVPELVGSGVRAGGAGPLPGGGAWPLLLLRPRGLPLPDWVAVRVVHAARRVPPAAAAAAAAAERRACACAATLGIFDALAAAHAAGRIHCDVRPSNVVVVAGEGGIGEDCAAVLVDWGSSCAAGANAARRGVAAFTDARVFEQGAYAARRAQDVAGALYTWLAVAFDGGCAAPWLDDRALASGGDGDVFAARARWLARRSTDDEAVVPIAAVIAEAGAGPQDSGTALLDRARDAVLGAQALLARGAVGRRGLDAGTVGEELAHDV